MWVIAPGASILLALGTVTWSHVSETRCAASLRKLYFEDDFDRAIAEGCAGQTNSSRVGAWYILNEERAKDSGAPQDAARLLKSRPNDPYATFAMAGGLLFEVDRGADALRFARLAASEEPRDETFQWVYADSLRLRGKLTEAEQAILNDPLTPRSALLLTELAAVRFDAAERRGFAGPEVGKALEAVRQANTIDPSFARPYYLAGQFFYRANKPDRARPYFAKAAALTWSDKIRTNYWNSVSQSFQLSLDQKVKIVLDDVRNYERAGKTSEGTYQSAAYFFQSLGLTRQYNLFVDKLLDKFPGTMIGVQERLNRVLPRVSLASVSDAPNRVVRKEVIEELRSIAFTPGLESARPIRSARVQLIKLLLETPSGNEQLLMQLGDRLIDDPEADPDSVATATIAIATVAPKDPRAAEVAAAKLKSLPSYIQSQHMQGPAIRLSESALGSQLAYSEGFANFRNGRLEVATHNLIDAIKYDPSNGRAMLLLGDIAQAQYDYTRAEQWYIRCSALPLDPKIPCFNSISRMYVARYGTEEGLDHYLTRLKPRILAATSRRIQQSVTRSSRTPLDFDLVTIDGRHVSSASTKGKVVVLIYWGIWCDACRIDLPEMFSYAQLFKHADDVIFATINDGKDLLKSEQWLRTQRAPITIVNPAFVKSSNIVSVPTTVFLDRRGREAYRIRGLLGSIDTEFGKRISILRNEQSIIAR